MWLIDKIEHIAEEKIRNALKEMGLEEGVEINLLPPKDPSFGDLGMPCHPLARYLRKNPKLIAEELAEKIELGDGLAEVRPINGYLNLVFSGKWWLREAVKEVLSPETKLGWLEDNQGKKVLIEFSGPNTNKPQHLGHARNNVLGLAMSNLLEASGYEVIRANIINDRGIHICKSMLAYLRWGEGKTPESVGKKGDFFVGDFYVLFEKKFKEEYQNYLKEHPNSELTEEEYFNSHSELGRAARELLKKWEEGDPEVRALWQKMNSWVYQGFEETYRRMGIEFDWIDYESDTYKLGKQIVEEGLKRGIFKRREDGAVVCDLSKLGREGEKVLLRSDGTSVYITQDLGTALRRYQKFHPDLMIYVVADEQNYHFELLFGILNLLQPGLGERCYHLSYGMVELPSGKMKSREGTVVDADNLMDELRDLALNEVRERYPELSEEEKAERAEKIAQAGLKFFLLKFSPPSKMRFNPEQSISFEGETGPYCLYAYARVNSIAQKLSEPELSIEALEALGSEREITLAKELSFFPKVLRSSVQNYNPSILAKYLFNLSKSFASFYQDKAHRIIDAEEPVRSGRYTLARAVQSVLKRGLEILGIETIEQM